MRRPRRNHALVVALYINAALLLAVLVALASGDRMPSMLSAAYGAPPGQQIAGGSGIYLMPGQLATNVWGCYLMDVDAQTLMAYQYSPGDKKLRLLAARNFRHDRKLHDFNTDNPTPAEVEKLLEMESTGRRDNPAPDNNPPPQDATGGTEEPQK